MYANLKKAVKAGDELVKIGEEIMKDGEIDFADIQHAPKLAGPVQELYEAFKNKDGMLDELKAFLEEKFNELKA